MDKGWLLLVEIHDTGSIGQIFPRWLGRKTPHDRAHLVDVDDDRIVLGHVDDDRAPILLIVDKASNGKLVENLYKLACWPNDDARVAIGVLVTWHPCLHGGC